VSDPESEASSTHLSITLHAIDADGLDIEALSRAAAAAVTTVGDTHLRIVVTGDFEAYVRQNDRATDGLPPYVQARLRGHAAGKLVTRNDGTVELLVDASVVGRDRDDLEAPERTFVHEALHLVLYRRDESTCARRARMGHELGTADGAFAGLAGQAGEEFRVERALREMGYPLQSAYRTELLPMAGDYASSLDEPFWEYQSTQEPAALERLLDAAVTGFDHLIPIIAYLVGDDVGAGVNNPPASTSDGPTRWIRDGYLALYEPLSHLPSARTPCLLSDLDTMLDPVEQELKHWFASIGFRWTGGPQRYSLLLTDPERLAQELTVAFGT
jgi:hypothetical protein